MRANSKRAARLIIKSRIPARQVLPEDACIRLFRRRQLPVSQNLTQVDLDVSGDGGQWYVAHTVFERIFQVPADTVQGQEEKAQRRGAEGREPSKSLNHPSG